MESIENEFVKLWIDDGIIYGLYKPDVVIDLEAAKKIASDRIQLSNNSYYPSLVYLSQLKGVTKEARDFFSRDDGIKYMKKLALITTSPISKMAGNFFLRISRPAIPTCMFTSKEEAIKWLKED